MLAHDLTLYDWALEQGDLALAQHAHDGVGFASWPGSDQARLGKHMLFCAIEASNEAACHNLLGQGVCAGAPHDIHIDCRDDLSEAQATTLVRVFGYGALQGRAIKLSPLAWALFLQHWSAAAHLLQYSPQITSCDHRWLDAETPVNLFEKIFVASEARLADVVRLAHARPKDVSLVDVFVHPMDTSLGITRSTPDLQNLVARLVQRPDDLARLLPSMHTWGLDAVAQQQGVSPLVAELCRARIELLQYGSSWVEQMKVWERRQAANKVAQLTATFERGREISVVTE